jgi:hypothetical protein
MAALPLRALLRQGLFPSVSARPSHVGDIHLTERVAQTCFVGVRLFWLSGQRHIDPCTPWSGGHYLVNTHFYQCREATCKAEMPQTLLCEVYDAPQGHSKERRGAFASIPHRSLREIADPKRGGSAPARELRFDGAKVYQLPEGARSTPWPHQSLPTAPAAQGER